MVNAWKNSVVFATFAAYFMLNTHMSVALGHTASDWAAGLYSVSDTSCDADARSCPSCPCGRKARQESPKHSSDHSKPTHKSPCCPCHPDDGSKCPTGGCSSCNIAKSTCLTTIAAVQVLAEVVEVLANTDPGKFTPPFPDNHARPPR
jgi:hypothetical protein